MDGTSPEVRPAPPGWTVRPVEAQDLDRVLDLLGRHQRDRIDETDRARRGFVQGRFTRDTLTRWLAGPGLWLAEIDGRLAGVVLSSAPGGPADGPPRQAMEVAERAAPGVRGFLYGPSVVDDAFRRRGVLRTLVDRLLRDAAPEYDQAVAFVERGNRASETAHERLGFREVGGFAHEGRDYAVVTRPTGPAPEVG